MKAVSQELFDYTVENFRHLHMYPELGFDLPKTVAYVSGKLDELGIAYTTEYGQCSLVGTIGSKEGVPTLGLRADMDALPVHEQVDVPYKSRHEGVMHACGHDSHTAILLSVAKVLKEREAELPCNIKLFFQPSEEGAISGAKMMVDNGCMEGVDAVICTHCEATIPSGTLGYHSGDYMAACIPIELIFHGITSHATLPENGVDAIAMAVETYGKLKAMVKEEAGDRDYIWSVGKFAGGDVHNVISDICTLLISFRYYDHEFAMRVMEKAEKICADVAKAYGGSYELNWRTSTVAVYNDPAITEKFCQAVAELPTVEVHKKKSSEDFAWYGTKAPAMLFRYGTGNAEKGCTATAHRPDFRIDEDAMKTAILGFVNFVMNYR